MELYAALETLVLPSTPPPVGFDPDARLSAEEEKFLQQLLRSCVYQELGLLK
jgi:hypothetical protein